MNAKTICRLSAISVLTWLVVATPAVSACELPDESANPRTVRCTTTKTVSTPVPIIPIAALASGDDPIRARELSETWQVLEPGKYLWYKTPYSEGFRILEFWLETAVPNTISMAFYSPDQTPGLSTATKPIGRGTHSNGDPDTILRWKAGYAKPGVWYILLTNNTNQPASFKLNSNMQNTAVKKCISYWETLPTGEYVYWTDCGFYTGPHD